MLKAYSDCLKELVKTDEPTAIFVELTKQLLDLSCRHADSEVPQSIREFFAVKSPASIVVDHTKRSASATNGDVARHGLGGGASALPN